MARSVGTTISAVVVFIGSAFTILCGLMGVLGFVTLSKSNGVPNIPANFAYFGIVVAMVLFFGSGGWGIASGIGLINTRPWARTSMVVFAALLVFFSLSSVLVVAVIPLPNANDPNMPSNFTAMMRVGMALFYGMFAALGGLWLYFFNKRSVKAEFQREQPVVIGAADLSAGTADARLSASPRARPISITIIGWFLLIGSALGPLFIPFSHAFFPGVPIPICFLGFFLFGRNAILVFLVWAAAQMVAAVGLLKLKNWGRLGTIGLQVLGVLNVVLLFGVPGNYARFQRMMETMTASMNAGMPQPVPFVFPAWVGIVISLPLFLVVLWFLITQKQAFTSAAQDPARQF